MQSDSFPPTRWSLVVRHGEEEAMEELCNLYWRPIYSYLRRIGESSYDAEDLTQSFFSELLADETLQRAREEKGKLRSFLLGALKRHLSAQKKFERRQKRGGGLKHLQLIEEEGAFARAEDVYAAQSNHKIQPDRLFEQRWAYELLARAHRRLQRDYEASGKGREYELLKESVTGGDCINGSVVAAALGVKEASVRVLMHRLRKNFKAAFKDEIAETVTSADEVEEEFHFLLEAF